MVEKFEQIKALCERKCLDKGEYIKILEIMEIPDKDEPEEINRVFGYLKDSIQKDHKNLSENIENPYVRLKFGESYLYRNLWERVRGSGLGHMSFFCVKKGYFDITINLSLGLHKSEDETSTDFQARQDAFFAGLPYDVVELSRVKMIADTGKNKELFSEWLNSFLNIMHIKTECRDGYIYKVNIFAKDIALCEKQSEKSDKGFDQASVEKICRFCNEAIDALHTTNIFKDSDKLGQLAMNVVSGMYIDICKEVGYTNEYCEKNSNKDISELSRKTHCMGDELGSQVSTAEILETSNKMFKAMEDRFLSDYSMWFSDIFWHDGVLHFKGKFSSDAAMFGGAEGPFKFDAYTIPRDREYLVDASYLKEVMDVIMQDYHLFNLDADVKMSDGEMVIKEISGMCEDLLSLPV